MMRVSTLGSFANLVWSSSLNVIHSYGPRTPESATVSTKRHSPLRHLRSSPKSIEFMFEGFHLSSELHVYALYGSMAGVKMMPSLPWLSFLKGSSKA